MKIHPLCAAWPLMPADELAELGEDIKKNGLRDRITLYDGQVLDGRNRMEAMEKAGVALTADNFEPYNGADPLGFVLSKNARRRHLDKADVAMHIAEMRKIRRAAGEKKATLPELAEKGGVSERTLKDAVAVVDKGIPAVREAVKAKEIPLVDGAALARKSKRTQQRAAEAGPDGVKVAAKKAAEPHGFGVMPPPKHKQVPPVTVDPSVPLPGNWTAANRDAAIARINACYEAHKSIWNSPATVPAPRTIVDAMIWAMNQGVK